MIRVASFFLLLTCLPLAAQRSDTVSFRLFTNSLAAGGSGLIRNIGQSQHLFFVQASDSGGTCTLTASGFDFFIEGSLDGTTYIPISTRTILMSTGSPSSTKQGYGFANGAFPFLRARYTAHPLNCRIDAWYSGTIPTTAYPQLPKAQSAGYFSSLARVSSAGSTIHLVNLSTGRIVVYGLALYNAAATANDVAIEARDGTCTGPVSGVVLDVPGLPARQSVVLPTGIVPWFISAEGASLCLTLGSATLVNSTIIYRIE